MTTFRSKARATVGLITCKASCSRRKTSASVTLIAGLLLTCLGAWGCEVPTSLDIKGGNPPSFVMKGNGTLSSIIIRGPKAQRNIPGEEALFYWRIVARARRAQSVDDIGEVVYGKVPEGYRQMYPESGPPPSLIEGERYYIRVDTNDANGAQKCFVLKNSKAEESRC